MLTNRPRARIAVAAIACAGSIGLVWPAGASAATTRPQRVRVANAQPDLSGATSTGRTASGQQVEVTLYLAQRNASELKARVRAVSTPGTAGYARYLSASAFRNRYAPTDAAVRTVRSFLAGAGLRVTEVPANHAYVVATGTAAEAEKAFSTSLHQYRMDGTTVRAAATPATVPAALAGTVIAVSGLASTSRLITPDHEDGARVAGSSAPARAVPRRTSSSARTVSAAPPPDAFVNAPPCSTYFGQKLATDVPPAYGKVQPYAPCGYVPDQLQGTYGLKGSIAAGRDGSGVTVAITDAYAAPTIVADANEYASRHGQDGFTAGQFRQVLPRQPFRYGYDDTENGDLCGEQGWYGEETLDVEAVHAVAPGADITYVASRSCDNADFAATLNTIVDRHLADIVTNSWGGTDESNGSPALDSVYEQIFVQAAIEGIGFYFSSGDSGDGSSAGDPTADPPVPPNGPTAQSPANSPYVTAVGGTTLAVRKSDKRGYETGWSTARSALTDGAWTPAPPGTYQYGAGGGTSRVYTQPWYQRGVVPNGLARRYSDDGTRYRVVPDVAAVGDPNTGFLVGETQTFPDDSVRYSEYRIGGTSLSSPVFAGIMAIADQTAGYAHGFANPALYRLYGTTSLYDPKAVSDRGVVRVDYVNTVDAGDGLVTSLRSIDVTEGTILRTRAGYDDITGIGTPRGKAFFRRLS